MICRQLLELLMGIFMGIKHMNFSSSYFIHLSYFQLGGCDINLPSQYMYVQQVEVKEKNPKVKLHLIIVIVYKWCGYPELRRPEYKVSDERKAWPGISRNRRM